MDGCYALTTDVQVRVKSERCRFEIFDLSGFDARRNRMTDCGPLLCYACYNAHGHNTYSCINKSKFIGLDCSLLVAALLHCSQR
eukprot:scaffold16896_cov63-Skeletonema_marinoi.AAC.1